MPNSEPTGAAMGCGKVGWRNHAALDFRPVAISDLLRSRPFLAAAAIAQRIGFLCPGPGTAAPRSQLCSMATAMGKPAKSGPLKMTLPTFTPKTLFHLAMLVSILASTSMALVDSGSARQSQRTLEMVNLIWCDAAGYVRPRNDGSERLNFTAFYEACWRPKASSFGDGTSTRTRQWWRSLSYSRQNPSSTANLLGGQGYTALKLDLKPWR